MSSGMGAGHKTWIGFVMGTPAARARQQKKPKLWPVNQQRLDVAAQEVL